MSRKTAILSNINISPLVRELKNDSLIEVYEPEGYGNELGYLLNPNSSYHVFGPEATFIWMDVAEYLGHETDVENAKARIRQWFGTFLACLKSEVSYFVSDVHWWGNEILVGENKLNQKQIEYIWMQELQKVCKENSNVYSLSYACIIEEIGVRNAYSSKMWYMGKIAHTQAVFEQMAVEVRRKVTLLSRVPKKVLVLDLDNTLWGGLAGEHDVHPIVLSEDHKGLAYKNLQRVILQMKKSGVMLAICSKNNREDAMEILQNHPHMVLRPENFVAMEINWERKPDNLRKIAQTLNVGLDSFVFFDDSDVEREMVEKMLPEVTVAQFPAKAENLAEGMLDIYRSYFEVLKITEEDREKTALYFANTKRQELQNSVTDFRGYLRELEMQIVWENPGNNKERLLQLVNKTNQFNLTTKRYEAAELEKVLENDQKQVYLYRVTDKFGDNGIVGVVIVDTTKETPLIEEFTMSCRVMGRQIEDYVLDYVEEDIKKMGFHTLEALYIPTAKNGPVEKLYDRMGYEIIEESAAQKRYRLELECKPAREFFVKES